VLEIYSSTINDFDTRKRKNNHFQAQVRVQKIGIPSLTPWLCCHLPEKTWFRWLNDRLMTGDGRVLAKAMVVEPFIATALFMAVVLIALAG